jgi:hypothetical protein
MSLSLRTMYCVVRIIGDLPVRDPDTKKQTGTRRAPIGTGFVVTVPSKVLENVEYAYLLTAHHVIADQPNVEAQSANPFAEGELYEPVPIKEWCQPLDGVDLALAPFEKGIDQPYNVRAISTDWGMVPNDLVHRPPLGATIFYVGLLTPDDRPMARSGTIGALDQKGLRFKEGYSYPAHLVDCRSYGGFSGSPCFLDLPLACLNPLSAPIPFPEIPPGIGPLGKMAHVALLCGMFTSHRTDEHAPENIEKTVSRYGVGVVLRSQEILEGLMVDRLRKKRQERDAEIQAAHEAAADESAFEGAGTRPTDADEFDRFEDLTGKLLKVPKKELDKKREEEGGGQ